MHEEVKNKKKQYLMPYFILDWASTMSLVDSFYILNSNETITFVIVGTIIRIAEFNILCMSITTPANSRHLIYLTLKCSMRSRIRRSITNAFIYSWWSIEVISLVDSCCILNSNETITFVFCIFRFIRFFLPKVKVKSRIFTD